MATKALQKATAHWTFTALGVLHWMCVGAFVVCVLDLVEGGSRAVVLALGFAMIGSLWLTSLLQLRHTNELLRAHMGPFPQHQRLIADDAGLTVESINGKMVLPWSEIRDLQSAPMHVFVLFGNGACFPIPERAFGSVERRTDFIAAVNAFRSAAAAA